MKRTVIESPIAMTTSMSLGRSSWTEEESMIPVQASVYFV